MDRYEKCIINLCLVYIIYVFLYGIVIKITFWNSMLFQIKTYIPELVLVLIILMSILRNGIKLKRFSIPLLGYSAFIFFINSVIYGFSEQAFYWVRDLYIPLVAFCFLLMIKFSSMGITTFQKKLSVFFKIYLIVGLILALIQQLQGWEWSSSFYTGYTFYGQDEVSKIKIAHNMGLLRAPSLSGNFATFGYYCLISVIFINANKMCLKKQLLWDIIALLCMVLATNKSAIVALLVVFVLRQSIDIRKMSIKLNCIILFFIIGFIVITTIMFFDDNVSGYSPLAGVFERFNVWKNILSDTSVLEIVFPYKQFLYGSGVEGGVSFFDNTYLYSIFTQGIIGTLLWVYALSNVYKSRMKLGSPMVRHYVYELSIALLVLGFTVNVTQGRGFFSLYLVLLAVGSREERGSYKNFPSDDAKIFR